MKTRTQTGSSSHKTQKHKHNQASAHTPTPTPKDTHGCCETAKVLHIEAKTALTPPRPPSPSPTPLSSPSTCSSWQESYTLSKIFHQELSDVPSCCFIFFLVFFWGLHHAFAEKCEMCSQIWDVIFMRETAAQEQGET